MMTSTVATLLALAVLSPLPSAWALNDRGGFGMVGRNPTRAELGPRRPGIPGTPGPPEPTETIIPGLPELPGTPETPLPEIQVDPVPEVREKLSLDTTTTETPSKPASYYVTFSKKVRPDMTLPVTVRLVRPGDRATVTVCLHMSTNESHVFAKSPPTEVTAGTGHTINLKMPSDLSVDYKTYGWYSYELCVTAVGDVTFNQSSRLRVEQQTFSIFVQSDKAMYNPGQTVKLRALAMLPDLRVLRQPIDMKITDPAGNTVRNWKQISGFENTGVVEKTLPLSAYAVEGDWNVDVTVGKLSETKSFTVDKYVLPRFEAMVDVPKNVLLTDDFLSGVAKAKYTYGKPLTDANVVVTVKVPYFDNPDGNRTQPSIVRTGVLNEKGELGFRINLTEVADMAWDSKYIYSWMTDTREDFTLNHRIVNVVVNITDKRTGHHMGSVSPVMFTTLPVKLAFLDISPSVYKPGLNYTAHLSVKKYDGSLFTNYRDITVTFNVTYTVPGTTTTSTTTTTTKDPIEEGDDVEKPRRPSHHGGWVAPETMHLKTVNMTLTPTGLLAVTVTAPDIAEGIAITASCMGVQSSPKDVTRAASASGNFLQIQARTDSPQIGHVASFDVKTTEPATTVVYQLYSKGIMLSASEADSVGDNRQLFSVSFPVEAKMAPNCRLLVFYFRDDGEVVADTMSVKINTTGSQLLNVTYNKVTAKPGEEVQLTVEARPSSTVFLLGIDKSVKLLKDGNDLTKEKVDEALLHYDFGNNFGGFWGYMRICGWPYPSQSSDAQGVFLEANVAIFTDGNVYAERSVGPGMFMSMRKPVRKAGGSSENAKGGDKDPADEQDMITARVRAFFPETWLFTSLLVGSEGRAMLKQTAPDTITTWLTTAFSVHPELGLTVVQQPTELTTFRDVFVSLDLPHSVKRGEDICMKAQVYNYHTRPLFMRLILHRNDAISNIRLVRKDGDARDGSTMSQRVEYRAPMKIVHRVGKMRPDEVVETTFCFTPYSLGLTPLRVDLVTSGNMSDSVKRMLLVEPEGVPKQQNLPVILDVKKAESFRHSVPIVFPDDVVAGSQRITVSVAGNLLGPVFDNIKDLLRMPYGCGEQNMLYFAPNVFLIDYLQKTNTYTEKLAKEAEEYMATGYQKQLTYQLEDGSFNTFGGKNNRNGSMWLTAFVVKSFAQSMGLQGDVVTIQPALVVKSINWMLDLQRPDGSFPEPGVVFNKNMQGGSAKDEALTAYVLVALAEANEKLKEKDSDMMDLAIDMARMYLEQQLDSLEDSYDLAIVTYALHLTASDFTSGFPNTAFEMLLKKAISGPMMTHWERPRLSTQPQYYYWQQQTDAINVEMTAYALLTYMKRGDITAAMPIVRWMTNQRGARGGFYSTQDTVVGLQALGVVATEIYEPVFIPIQTTFQWDVKGEHRHLGFTVNDDTKLLLQKSRVDIQGSEYPVEIVITASTEGNFSGVAVAEVTLDYNVISKTDFTTYQLNPTVEEDEGQEKFKVTVVAWRRDGVRGSMTVIEVGVPTGYVVDQECPSLNVTGASMNETEGKKYILYYDEMGADPVTATIPMIVTEGIPVNVQPTPVTVYDYYEAGPEASSGSDKQAIEYYHLSTTNFICDKNPLYESCRYLTKKRG